MISYRPPAFRKIVSSPTFRRQAHYSLGQTFDGLFKWDGAVGDTIRLVAHGTTAVLGYYVWIKDKGFWKYFGLAIALEQTIGVICDVISLTQRALGTHPPENGDSE